MINWNRFISYIYRYHNGKKCDNAGFAKVSRNGDKCSVHIGLRDIMDSSRSCYNVYLYVETQDIGDEGPARANIVYIPKLQYLGKMCISRGRGTGQFLTDWDNIGGSHRPIMAFNGIYICRDDGSDIFCSSWTDNNCDYTMPRYGDAPAPEHARHEDMTLPGHVGNEDVPIPKHAGHEDVPLPGHADRGEVVWNAPGQIKDDGYIAAAEKTQHEEIAGHGEAAEHGEVTGYKEAAEDRTHPEDSGTEHGGTVYADLTGDVPDGGSSVGMSAGMSAGTVETDQNSKVASDLAGTVLDNMASVDRAQMDMNNRISAVERLMNTKDKLPDIVPTFFTGGTGDSAVLNCVKITPNDIGLLDMNNWKLGINSFLTHGYYSYRYILLGRLVFDQNNMNDKRYVIGVPGIYSSREKYLADIFGFGRFIMADKNDRKTGRFGYWVTDVAV